MKVYVISVLHTRTNEDTNEKEVVASMPIAVYTDKNIAVKQMQNLMDAEEMSSVMPRYNMYRSGAIATASLTEEYRTEYDTEFNLCRTEVTLRTIDVNDEAFDIQEAVTAAWN